MMFRVICPVILGWMFVVGVMPGKAQAQGVEEGLARGCVEGCAADTRGGMLGTFYPTPYMTVGGNGDAGFTPLQQYGSGTLSLYGPFSALRPVAAPARVVTRGYRGVVEGRPGVAVSYPFLPSAGAPLYPRRAQVRGAGPVQTTPPWWDTGHHWVDYD